MRAPSCAVAVDVERRGRGEALCEDPGCIAVLAIAAHPGHDEVAVGVDVGDSAALVSQGVRVDLEHGALSAAGGVEAASGDAEAGNFQPQVFPDDEEVAVGLGGHRRVALVVDGAQVDLEVGALRHRQPT